MYDETVADIRAVLRQRGLDAYLAYTPSNVFYATGFQSYFLMEWWRMHGTVMALVPARDDLEPALLVSDFEAEAARRQSGIPDLRAYRLWVDMQPLSESARPLEAGESLPQRPAQYDPDEQDRLIASAVADRGLSGGRIGTDLRYILKDSYDRLAAALPGVHWADVTEDLYRLRSIKKPYEVERLKRATELSEAGMRAAAARVNADVTAIDLRHAYSKGVIEAAQRDQRYRGFTHSWVLPTIGAGVSPEFGARTPGIQPGALVKFDCGATVDGYRSDGGRTFIYREREPRAERLHRVLREAHEKARTLLRPGVRIADVFAAAQDHVRANGLPRYNRGHFGHSVGIDTFHEEPPYVAPDEQRRLEPGMVLAIETPFYGDDIGAVMIEDLVHIVADGHEVLHELPYDLTVVG